MDEHHPLLASDHHRIGNTDVTEVKHQVKRFLTSKTGHYSVLLLVSLDITSIFADLILQFALEAMQARCLSQIYANLMASIRLTCEGRVSEKDGNEASEILGIVGLVFSCLFMVELLSSILVFGWNFFKSWFHCVDATVITVAFVVDVVLKGVLEEVGSLVVILRLWRVIKIIEELSAGADEQMEPLREKIEDLEKENSKLRSEVGGMRTKSAAARA